MVKLKNFTLEGKAFNVIAYGGTDDRPRFTIELASKFDKEGLSIEEFDEFCEAVAHDSSPKGVLWCSLIGDMKEGGELEDYQDQKN